MSPLLSITRLGFDKDPNVLRDIIAELNSVAGDLGEAIGELALRNFRNVDAERRLKALRLHRYWLMEQAAKLQQKLDGLEGVACERDVLVQAAAALGCDAGGRV